MAGHSAWKNIKHRKAAIDRRRGKVWTKCSRAIIVAARAGGGDPDFNAALRYAIDEAKAANMPRDTIEKAVKKATGAGGGESYDPVRYEGYGPGGAAIIVDCLVANANKTAPEIRTLFERHEGKLGVPGSVAYNFQPKGMFLIEASKISEDRLVEVALDAGAEDVRADEGAWVVVCEPGEFHRVRTALEAAGVACDSAEITMTPLTRVDLNDHAGATVLKLIEALEEHDDVQKVHHNATISDAVLAAAG